MKPTGIAEIDIVNAAAWTSRSSNDTPHTAVHNQPSRTGG